MPESMSGSMSAAAAVAGDGDRRRWERHELDRPAAARLRADARSYDCAVGNISLGGARLRIEEGGPADGQVVLDHPVAGRLPGRLVWRAGQDAGIAFERPDTLANALQCVCLLLYQDERPRQAAGAG